MHSNKESFGSTKVGVSFEIFLQYFKMVHKESIPNFGFKARARFGRYVNFFILEKFFNINGAPMNVIVSLFCTRKSSMFRRPNSKNSFSTSNVRFITSTSKLINHVASIEFANERLAIFSI